MPRQIANVVGEKFGQLIVLMRVDTEKYAHAKVLCQCDCGEQKIIRLNDVKTGRVRSCGCLKVKNLIGKRFNKLVVIARAMPRTSANGQYALWDCQCDCGEIVKGAISRNLKKGDKKSCGCAQNVFLSRKYGSYSHTAKKRGYKFDLTRAEFEALINSNCHYCGVEPTSSIDTRFDDAWNGIDRVNNSVGYLIENCVPCCTTCNTAKGTLSTEEFLAWAKRLYYHQSIMAISE